MSNRFENLTRLRKELEAQIEIQTQALAAEPRDLALERCKRRTETIAELSAQVDAEKAACEAERMKERIELEAAKAPPAPPSADTLAVFKTTDGKTAEIAFDNWSPAEKETRTIEAMRKFGFERERAEQHLREAYAVTAADVKQDAEETAVAQDRATLSPRALIEKYGSPADKSALRVVDQINEAVALRAAELQATRDKAIARHKREGIRSNLSPLSLPDAELEASAEIAVEKYGGDGRALAYAREQAVVSPELARETYKTIAAKLVAVTTEAEELAAKVYGDVRSGG